MKTQPHYLALAKTFLRLALAIIGFLLLEACTEHIIYKQSNGSNVNGIYSLSSNKSSPVAIASGSDALFPCGPTNDGRVVYTRITSSNGGDIYVVNAEDGSGLTPVRTTTDDEQCVFVTPNNLVIYEDTVPAWNGRHNIMAIPLGSAIPQNVATDGYDQLFKAYAPDKSVVYLRQSPLRYGAYDILATKIGGQFVVLAQIFPTNFNQPTFNAVSKDNRVIFSEPTEYKQGATSLNIFSVSTDGSNAMAIAQDPPALDIFCALTSDNRILYTRRSTGVVNGMGVTYGDLYAVNPDGTNRTLLRKGPPDFDDTCEGVTFDNYVIFVRNIGDRHQEGEGELYSILADGISQPVLLASASSDLINSTANVFEKTTPANRVLFRTINSTETSAGRTYSVTLNSINPDGTGLVSLASEYNLVQGVTIADRVIFNSQVPGNGSQITLNLFIVPSTGGTAPVPIAPTTDTQDLSFIFYY
ncbi:MAG TPA: hypothetical protein VEG25_00470 [Burkholderiales bacterium]|nr:hypothetical protein [Burkholderiales bacterium]